MNKYNDANPSNKANIDEIIAVIKSKWQIVIALIGTELQIFKTNIFFTILFRYYQLKTTNMLHLSHNRNH